MIKVILENRGFAFIKSLCSEITNRLPDNFKFYNKLKFLSPAVCLSQTIRSNLAELPFIEEFTSAHELDTMENQWNWLLTVDWGETYGKNVFESSYTI